MLNVGRLQEQSHNNPGVRTKVVDKVIDCKPLGHKPKAALPGDVKVGKVDAKVGKDKKAPVKLLATPLPARKVTFEEHKKKPPERDAVNA